MKTLTCHPSVAHIWKPIAEHYELGFETDDQIDLDVVEIDGPQLQVMIDWRGIKGASQ